MTLAQYIPIICAVISTCCALFVAFRTGRWRETDDAKAIAKRFADVEGRVQAVEIHQEHMPTKADFATLVGKINEVEGLVVRAESAVNRIEGYLITHGTTR